MTQESCASVPLEVERPPIQINADKVKRARLAFTGFWLDKLLTNAVESQIEDFFELASDHLRNLADDTVTGHVILMG